ncbi:hypothetical protein Godav_011455, partial [Gossypium davidsonii]|nr:hypothetical protein [Gossypium davidsonii]
MELSNVFLPTRLSFNNLRSNCRCLAAKGEESNQCEKFAKYYRSLCPGEWVSIPCFSYHHKLTSGMNRGRMVLSRVLCDCDHILES